MPTVTLHGIEVNYVVHGNGPPLLMLAPGGFDATVEKWSTAGVWKSMQPLRELASDFQLIAYDRRECGQSGGRVEPLTWKLFAEQARQLLDHLGIDSSFVLGACMGCSVAAAYAAQFPEACRGLILHWPVGGYRWRVMGRQRFDEHLAFARAQGLAAVVERAQSAGSFWQDPSAGPWASLIARSADFARAYVQQPLERYLGIVAVSRDGLFPNSQPTGVTEEELLGLTAPTLIVGGNDEVHTRSAAWILRELIPGAGIAPDFPPDQDAAKVAGWIRAFVAQQRSAS